MNSAAFANLEAVARAAPPSAALVLGSGIGLLVQRVRVLERVPFGDVPGLTATGVHGHRGCLTLGEWGGRHILVFEGRLHFYEGHPWERVVEPVRVAARLGVRALLLTNAAGGIHDDLGPGSLMAIRDHVEWTRPYGWRHPGPGGLGGERPSPYDVGLLDVVGDAAAALGIPLLRGVYAQLTGPCYETPAEIRALKAWGADAVGMSTAREVQTGHDLGLRCAAVSCITNKAAGLCDAPLDHAEVLVNAAAASERLADLLERVVERLPVSC
jgi:purine-nucleoside phosphorylase